LYYKNILELHLFASQKFLNITHCMLSLKIHNSSLCPFLFYLYVCLLGQWSSSCLPEVLWLSFFVSVCYLSVCLPAWLCVSVCLSVFLSPVCLSVCLFLCLFACLSVFLLVCLSVCLIITISRQSVTLSWSCNQQHMGPFRLIEAIKGLDLALNLFSWLAQLWGIILPLPYSVWSLYDNIFILPLIGWRYKKALICSLKTYKTISKDGHDNFFVSP